MFSDFTDNFIARLISEERRIYALTRPLTEDEARTMRAVEAMRKMAPYCFPDDSKTDAGAVG